MSEIAASPRDTRFETRRKQIGLLLGPAVFCLILLLPFDGLSPAAHRLGAIVALVIAF